MVTTQQLANKLNDAMNTIAASMSLKHTFKLMAHLGKAKDSNAIQGILKPVQTHVKSQGGTGAGINSVHNVYVAEFVTPSAIDNYYATIVEQVINALVETEDGNSFTIGSDTVIWELECGIPKEYAVRDGVGSSIPFAFTISVTYTDNALLNGVKVWTLDGNSIPYEAEAVVLNKEGRIIPIYEYKNQQGIMLGQNKQYKFRIPYNKNDVVCTTLQSDILNGDFRKRYTLAYDDGVIQFSTTVSLYQTGDMGTQKTEDPTDIVVSFIDVGQQSFDIGNNTTIEYSIALIDWEFDNTSENTLYFASQAAQQAYISDGSSLADSIVNDPTKSTLYMPFYAPNLGSQINTHVEVDCTYAYDVNSAANHNYAVVRKRKIVTVNNVATTTTQYFYYWVINPVFGANGMLSMDLQMDTIQTYMFDSNLTIPDCMIERAHLNRWVEVSGDTTKVQFDGSTNSKLFEREPIQNFPKRLLSRQQYALVPSATKNIPTEVDTFFQNYLTGWLYVYFNRSVMDAGDSFGALIKNNGWGNFYEFVSSEQIYQPYLVACFPLFKSNATAQISIIGLNGTFSINDLPWDAEEYLSTLMNLTGNDAVANLILSVKISQTPPLKTWWANGCLSTFTIDSTNQKILKCTINFNTAPTTGYFIPAVAHLNDITASSPVALFLLSHEMSSVNDVLDADNGTQAVNITETAYRNITLPFTNTFTKSSIISSNKNISYNPKLLGQDYTELKLGQGCGVPYIYDPQKINSDTAVLRWREALTPSVVRTFLSISSNKGIYTDASFRGLIGCMASQDTTMPYSTDMMQEYLQNNKNFYLQQGLSMAGTAAGGALGAAAIGATAGSAVPGVGTLIGAGAGLVAGIVQTGLSIDNMKNMPENLKNLNGDPVLTPSINNGQTYIEIHQALPSELKIANDFMFMNGFTYNQVDSPLDYIHTRKYFNYIKAQIGDIQGVSLSNEIRNDIKQRFANGIRFWDNTTFATNGVQYDKENYELWLEAQPST